MLPARWFCVGAVAGVVAIACSDNSDSGQGTADAGAIGNGGAAGSSAGSGNGGASQAGSGNGGANNAGSSNGGFSQAGAGNGGIGNGGSSQAGAGNGGIGNGGAATGGTLGNGGAETGGATGTGGAGGAPGKGGATTGGATGTGGAATGGAPGTGGAATGGAPGTGGAATGGAPGTGGAATGGAPGTGGAQTGGAPGTGGGCTCSAGGSAGTGGSSGTSPVLGGCAIYPPDNPWNTRVDDRTAFPPDPNSATILTNIKNHAQASSEAFLHADFVTNFGIPYIIVPSNQSTCAINPNQPDESDPGPYPIPLTAPIESDTDAHVIALQSGSCKLFELDAAAVSGGGWNCYSAAMFDLSTNTIRSLPLASCPTSADAAGLPIFAGLVKYDEVATGHINHAVRFTVHQTRRAFVRPATHYASSITDTSYPPMGMRVRLLSVPSGLTGQALVVATALKEYGMILADNGSNWYISGAPNAGFDNTDLNQLKTVPETAFEVVQMGKVYTPADCP